MFQMCVEEKCREEGEFLPTHQPVSWIFVSLPPDAWGKKQFNWISIHCKNTKHNNKEEVKLGGRLSSWPRQGGILQVGIIC